MRNEHYDSSTPTLLKTLLLFCPVVGFVYSELLSVAFFFPQKNFTIPMDGS